MRLKRFVILSCVTLFLAGVLVVALAPVLVAGGLRLWAARVAGREGLQIEWGEIDAPLLRPVILRRLQIQSGPDAPFRVFASAARVQLNLNLAGLFGRSNGRIVRSLAAEGIVVDVRRSTPPPEAPRRFAWSVVENLLANNFKLSEVELHVENGNTIVDLHHGTLSGAEIEPGVFSARQVEIESPWFRKSLSNLAGATAWREGRFTLGAISLMPGVGVDAFTVDLSQIGESRIGLEINLDAFEGKLRARVSSDDGGDKRIWDAAGAASEISLAQMSDALEWTNRASGSVHACKFTFRGEVSRVREATASVWAEVSGLTWRDRTADTVMIGASLNNQSVQVEQLYIKQRDNQLTLSGEFALPQKTSAWLKPDFRADVSGAINDLGNFARLFGATASDFAGRIAMEGSLNARERSLSGDLTVSGNSLILFRAPVEALNLKIGLQDSQLEIAQFELRHQNDSFRGDGRVDLQGDRTYSATFTTSVADVARYAGLIPDRLAQFSFGGALTLDWSGTGNSVEHSGIFHLRGSGLHPLEVAIKPFEADFEGSYSPDSIFFRQFQVSNQDAALSAFVTVAKDYLQFQTLRFDLKGKPRLHGNVFVPLSPTKLRTNNWLSALNADPNFDADLILDQVDLGELAAAITTNATISGQAAGRIEIYGTPGTLEGRSEIRLRDFAIGNEPRLSINLEGRLGFGILNLKANAIAAGSGPVQLEGSMPFQLVARESGYDLNTDGPISATLNIPAIFLARMPSYLSRGIFTDGILSGKLAFSDSLHHPGVFGDLQLINGKLPVGSLLSTRLTFAGQRATIDFANWRQKNSSRTARGEIDLRDLSDIGIKISPSAPLVSFTRLEPEDCVNGFELSSAIASEPVRSQVNELGLRGSIFTGDWTITLQTNSLIDPLQALGHGDLSRTFQLCPGDNVRGKTLTFGAAKPLAP